MAKLVILDLIKIFKGSIAAVLPQNLIKRALKYNKIGENIEVVGDTYNLQNKNLYVVGMGKAVQQMGHEVENILKSKIKQGIISIPMGSLSNISKNTNIQYCEGAANNLPDNQAQSTAIMIKNLVTKLGHNDFLLVLISGGGSALLPLPKEPITLKEKTMFIKQLANAGADIKELNTVRKRISDLKGGQLAIKAQPAQVVSLILSDIVNDPLDLIASGPTVENVDTSSGALNIIKKYKILDDTPESIKNILNVNLDLKSFPRDNVKNYIIGSNKLSTTAAVSEAESLNYIAFELSHSITGRVSDVAKEYVFLTKMVCEYLSDKIDIKEVKSKQCSLNLSGLDNNFINKLKDFDKRTKGICLIFGGETTVEVNGNGKGGRNQQMALEFSKSIHEVKAELVGFDIYFLSAGTDGIDGPTDAAGAIGYLDLISDALKDKIDVHKYIDNNDSYNFYKKFKDGNLHVITGHTNTNVMDIQIIIIRSSR